MERSNRLEIPAREESLLRSALQKAGEALEAWQGKRRTANVVAELSADQILDCGIAAAGRDLPSFEVPSGLMQKLMSMR